ncbi:DUF3168 domain-containing protein [Sagittula salina]|uniref:DUF3168 domain-containing protein n=1 Tax=Sagittula salina TaxID=2820268 RepID=A0A940S1W9_9RHOB|nr:DUF3168 domain-containing protein [Sagittula salina]MBP0480995.1 DUF3168 domain-containing protein [Sagittula salina]
MTYAVSASLQTAVYGLLQADAALGALVGAAIFDRPPAGSMPGLYVALGPERVREAGDKTAYGAWHEFEVSVVTESAGFLDAKNAAGAISDVLHGADVALGRGVLVGLWFLRARAGLETDGRRRIDLTFRARVEDTVAP